MENNQDKQIVIIPLRNPYPLKQLLRAGWDRLLLAAVFLGVGYFAWALNWSLHKDWADILVPVYKQLFSPGSGFISLDLRGVGPASLAFLILFLTGMLGAEALLPGEQDRWLKRMAALLLGFGFIGTITTLLAAFFQLHFLTLCFALGGLLLFLLGINIVLRVKRGASIPAMAREMFQVWKVERSDFSDRKKNLLFIFCLLIFGIMEYQALRFIELDWDALIYHANMAMLMFRQGGVPVIAGPSAGLELSANYPPLFSALGAYFYVFSGQFNDTYLRMLAPIFSLINLIAVYKIGESLGDRRYGAIAVVVLVFTPLYFFRSLFATNYLPVTTFLTAGLLFFLKRYQTQQDRYWPVFGLMFGFALLTSYHALIFAPSILILSFLTTWWTETQRRKRQLRACLASLALAFAFFAIWLLRNTIYVHNPIYPFGSQWLGGLHFDTAMFNQTVSAIRKDSIFNYFGTFTPTIPVFLQRIFVNRSQFPSISILLILGALIIPFDRNRRGWAMVGLYILPVGLLLASTVMNIFPRYFVLILPECALIVAFLLTKILVWGDFGFVTASASGRLKYQSSSTFIHVLTGILIGLMFLFPGNLAVVLGKQYGEADIYKPNYWEKAPGSQDIYGTLAIVYGEGVRAWEWLRPKIANPPERVASFENRTYYLTDDVNSMLYLDGWEAKPLYAMTEPEQAAAYLRAHQVTYILDPAWVKNWQVYRELPLNRFLGDPEYFPLVFDSPEAKIYQVGRVEDPLTEHSPLAIYLSTQGWGQPEFYQGYRARRIEKNTTANRLFVSYADQIALRVEYFDAGTGTVDINVKMPDGSWNFTTHLSLTNSNQWITRDLVLPRIDPEERVEIGIFSQSNDFIVKQLSARPAQ